MAVGAVIEDDRGRILLVRHVKERKGFWAGKWICPGGRLEPGETIEEGILREVLEETNLEIDLAGWLPPFERIVKEEGNTTLHVIYIDRLARVRGGELRCGSDVGEAVWVEKERIEEMATELHEDTRRLLQLANIIAVGGN